MPDQRLPAMVEIKRVIAAAMNAGVQIGKIEIHPNKIIIHPVEQPPREPTVEELYTRWKAGGRKGPSPVGSD